MEFFKLTIYLFCLLGLSKSEECIVKDQKINSEKPCVFPFILNDKIYYGCTTDFVETKNLACSTKTNADNEHIRGHWGECNPNTCTNNALYSQEDNEKALEIKDLVNQHKVNDNLNNEIATRSFGSGTFEDCPCVHVLECERTKSLLELMKGLSRSHPERSSIMTYVKSQICDEQNQKVRCCGQQQKRTKVRTTTTTWQQTRQISVNEQDLGTWKPQASKRECGTPLFSQSILGGKTTKFGSYPFMALLGYEHPRYGLTYECGGTVINKYYILTAAHCMNSKNPSVVILGEHNLSRKYDQTGAAKRTEIAIEEIIIHKDYQKTFQRGAGPHDIALIRVKEPIPFYNVQNKKSSNVIPICLPWNINDPGRQIYHGERLKVLGWGKTTNDNTAAYDSYKRIGAGSNILQQLDVPAISNRKCKTYLNLNNLNSRGQLCAGAEEGKDSCGGDSGGPLIKRAHIGTPWFQTGVVSFGSSQCGTGYPGVYTRVAAYLTWIEENLKP